jgi:hypothetical protein
MNVFIAGARGYIGRAVTAHVQSRSQRDGTGLLRSAAARTPAHW